MKLKVILNLHPACCSPSWGIDCICVFSESITSSYLVHFPLGNSTNQKCPDCLRNETREWIRKYRQRAVLLQKEHHPVFGWCFRVFPCVAR